MTKPTEKRADMERGMSGLPTLSGCRLTNLKQTTDDGKIETRHNSAQKDEEPIERLIN